MKRYWILLLLLLLLTGCAAEQEPAEPQALSLVLGHHACFPQTVPAHYEQQIYDVAYSYGQISAVISDGQPELAALFENKAPGKTIDNTKRQQLAQTAVQTIVTQLAATRATEPEIDTLGAVHVAAQALHASGMAQKTLLIVDSGLSTGGVLNFAASNLLDAEPDAVVEALRQRDCLPDLTGMDVVFLGLGQTAGEQRRPDAQVQRKLQAIWQAVLEAGQPRSIRFDPTPLSGSPGADLPRCSTVELVTECLQLEQENLLGEEPIRLSNVQFISDTSEFLDWEAVMEALMPVGTYLETHPEAAIWLAGRTATPGGTGEALS